MSWHMRAGGISSRGKAIDLNSGLLAEWRLEEPSGSTAFDYSGNGNHLANLGVTKSVDGFEFTSPAETVLFGDVATMPEVLYGDSSNPFAFYFRLRWNGGLSGTRSILSLNEPTNGKRGIIVILPDGLATLRISTSADGNTPVVQANDSSPLISGTWEDILVQYTGTKLELYRGISRKFSVKRTIFRPSESQVRIGGYSTFNDAAITIARMRLWNRSLGSGEIALNISETGPGPWG